ncbi:MAG: MmgE/PrpD family protein [Deltaproteobacteria bacterium]|nr:MmgE/PrpD family protein [Deltaproteobacteria bacterium]
MPEKTLAGRIAEYALSLGFDALPAPVVHEVKRRVIDALGCAVGAMDAIAVKAAIASVPVARKGLKSHIIGRRFSTTPDNAAFANGVMVRYLDFNDTYLSLEPAHPSDNISAAMAIAEAFSRNGKALIAAIVAAYEVQCGLCDSASLRKNGFDHVAYGAFSSVVAASMLMGLTLDQTVHALGISGVTSPALRQTRAGELSMWKGAAFANAARGGVFACILAKNGMTGPAPVFEGEFGFMRLISGPLNIDRFGGEGGAPLRILDSCIKYYPIEYHAQSAVGAAIELSALIPDTAMIDDVIIHTFNAAYDIIGSGQEKWTPKTRETADHSLPFCVAAALIDRKVNLDTFTDERIRDGAIVQLCAKIKVVKDPALDALYPKAMPNRIEVRLKSGQTFSREIVYPKGHPKNPLTDAEVEGKFLSLVAGRIADNRARQLLDMLWALETLDDVGGATGFFSDAGAL